MLASLYDTFVNQYETKLPQIYNNVQEKEAQQLFERATEIVQQPCYCFSSNDGLLPNTKSIETLDRISIIKKRDQELLKVANSYAKKNTCLIQ